jgi:hypothetical protein
MPQVMPMNEPAHPVDVILFCLQAVMQIAQVLAQLLQQAGRNKNWPVFFVESVTALLKYSVGTAK